jgi:diguanylate cyclase (GGDEF)-like protein
MNFADRTSFHHHFEQLWKESVDEKELLSLIICEVDCFQPYTDHYGKQAAEDVLLIVACILLELCDKYGYFTAHIEDERFVLLIKGGNATNALKVAEELRLALEQTKTEHATSEVDDIVTMSVGLSSLFPSKLNSMQILNAEADSALQTAKKEGQNQISVH